MKLITPQYVDAKGAPITPGRSLWEMLFGYKPTYQTVPTKSDVACDRASAEEKSRGT